MEIGVVGLGVMGEPIAARLVAAGHQVVVNDRSHAAAKRLADLGAFVAGGPTDVAARADVVVTTLPTTAAVESVYRDLCAVARAGQVFVEHSTIGPELARTIAAKVALTAASYLDAPVSGGPEGAAAGTLTVMAAGTDVTLDRVRGVLDAYSEVVAHCGEVGAGQVVKLVNQLLVAVQTAAVAEAAVLAARLGAAPTGVAEVLSRSYAASRMLDRNVPRFVRGDFAPGARTSVILKDISLAYDAAQRVGVPLRLGAVAQELFLEAVGGGLAAQDMAALVKLWEEPAGVVLAATGAGRAGEDDITGRVSRRDGG